MRRPQLTFDIKELEDGYAVLQQSSVSTYQDDMYLCADAEELRSVVSAWLDRWIAGLEGEPSAEHVTG